MKKKKKATKWIIFARVLLVLQLIASAMIFAMAVKTKMLPAKYIMFAARGFINYGVPGVCTCSLRTKHNETKSVGLF